MMRRHVARRALWSIACVALTCTLAHQGVARAAAAPASAAQGFSTAWLDRSCKPCDDFAQYAAGGWLKANPIPAKSSWWGHIPAMRDDTSERIRRLLEAAVTHPRSIAERQAGTFYGSCVDEATIAQLGLAPVAPELARIAAVSDRVSLIAEVAHLHDLSVGALFGFSSEASVDGFDKPEIIDFGQSGLSLPDKSYYLDPAKAATRDAFADHAAKMFVAAGIDAARAAADATALLAFETQLATISRTPAELRDPIANTHAMPFAAGAALIPAFDLAQYAADRGVATGYTIDVNQPAYFTGLSALIEATPLPTMTAYLRYRLLTAYAGALPPPFVNENFHFYGTVLTGTPTQEPRWQRCAATTQSAVGESVGAMYNAAYFPPAARARAAALVSNVKAVLRDDLATLTWMTPPTRVAALAKLDGMISKVGYPAVPRDYSAIALGKATYLANVIAANQFATHRALAKLGKPVDRQEWSGPSSTINAYYSSSSNSINVYAGILQAPLFDAAADDAFNYGATASMMGHEMTHGFDDSGRHFDAHGALRDWWTPADAAAFDARAACVEKQFDAFEVVPGVHANGKLELGEAIADLGGVTIAYRAFERSQAGKPRTIVDGFTPEQRFFIGFSILNTEADRDAYAKMRATSEPHPLGRLRIDGAYANLAAFTSAFACPINSAMTRPAGERCSIW